MRPVTRTCFPLWIPSRRRHAGEPSAVEDKASPGRSWTPASAGIIAGAAPAREAQPYRAAALVEDPQPAQVSDLTGCPSGVAPLARLVNIKVLNDDGTGSASCAIQGLEYLRKLNQSSRSIRVDGVNMSLGYAFDPQS